MSDDSFFDPIDSELRRRFDAASPRTPGDPDAVLDDLRPQLRRARTRHRAALGGMAAGVVAIVAVAGFALTGGASNPNVNTPPATHSSVPEPDVTAPTVPTRCRTATSSSSPGRTVAARTTAPSQPGGAADSGSSGSTGDSGSDATPTTVACAQTQTSYSSAGGSITVQLSGGQVSLVSATLAGTGASHEVHDNGPDKVEVRFFDASDHEISRIRVEVVNGALVRTA